MTDRSFNFLDAVRKSNTSDNNMFFAVFRDLLSQKAHKFFFSYFDHSSSETPPSRTNCPATQLFSWQYHSKLAIPESFFKKSTFKYSQDQWDQEKNIVVTELTYKAELIPFASVITNGHSHVSVYTENGDLHEGYSWYKKLSPPAKQYKKPTSHYSGVTLNLSSMGEAIKGNFAHGLIDELAKELILDIFKDNAPALDYVLVPNLSPAFNELYDALGLPKSKLITLESGKSYSFENLLCISAPRGSSSNICAGWIIDGYRKRIKKSYPLNQNKYKKIYVSRQDAGSRKIIQEDKLIDKLSDAGYVPLELSKLTIGEKAGIFSRADSVIGLTGAGMLNVMFCKPGTEIIEICPSNNINYINYSIAKYLDLEQRTYITKSETTRKKSNPFVNDVAVDIDHFLDTVCLNSNSALDKID